MKLLYQNQRHVIDQFHFLRKIHIAPPKASPDLGRVRAALQWLCRFECQPVEGVRGEAGAQFKRKSFAVLLKNSLVLA